MYFVLNSRYICICYKTTLYYLRPLVIDLDKPFLSIFGNTFKMLNCIKRLAWDSQIKGINDC